MKRTLLKKCSAVLLMAAFLLTTLPAAAALATPDPGPSTQTKVAADKKDMAGGKEKPADKDKAGDKDKPADKDKAGDKDKPADKDKAGDKEKPADKDKAGDKEKPADKDKPAADRAAYMSGYPDGTFRPGQKVSRAETAAAFSRLYLQDKPITQQLPVFSDIDNSGKWYENDVATVVNAKYMSGYPDGSFRPEAPITRAELAAMLTRDDKSAVKPARFKDIKGHWAAEAIGRAHAKGWISGYPDGNFRPDAPVTRAELCALFNRFAGRSLTADEAAKLAQQKGSVSFKDVDAAHWAYKDILAAANAASAKSEQ
ncbi:MAG: S-layer homology domain-containing protein [Clostridia bacterium]|nr:S-layer homology domain-containing protein [Clostridia bacterium]